MKNNRGLLLALVAALWVTTAWAAESEWQFDRYHSLAEMNAAIRQWAEAHPDIARVHVIARSAGQNEMLLLEISPELGAEKKTLPAVMVVANMEGDLPVSSEAALISQP